MNIIKTPPVVHSAFNPIMFVVTEQPTIERAELVVSISNQDVKLSRQCVTDADGLHKASFDVSGVVKAMLSNLPCEAITRQGVADNRLFVEYSVGGVVYVALNAVAQIGETTDLGAVKYPYYTDTHKIHQGYERDITSLKMVNGSMAVVRTLIDPLATDQDYLLNVSDNLAISPQCTPMNPFYVRWLNRLGGIDYYMFGRDQEVKHSAKSAQSIALYNTDTSNAHSAARAFGITADRTVVVGVEGIAPLEYKILSELPTSPIIEWFNDELHQWQTITVNKADNTFSSRFAQQSFEVAFDLPELNLQFA